jgi:hypothetical protein
MLHGYSYMVVPRRGVQSGEAVPTDQLLLHIPQLLVREREPCQPEPEVPGIVDQPATSTSGWRGCPSFTRPWAMCSRTWCAGTASTPLTPRRATVGTVTVQRWPLLGVSYKGICFPYNVLPFGPARACRACTMVTRRMVQPLRAAGELLTFHLDGLFLAQRS